MMWRIVCFEEDNTVDVVPDFWFENGYCEWPNKTNRMDSKSSIKRRMKPNEINFTKYKARSLLTNIATFKEAKSKAMEAQEASELSSNDKLSKPPIVEESEPESTIDASYITPADSSTVSNEVESIENTAGSTVEDLPSSAAENDTDNQSTFKEAKSKAMEAQEASELSSNDKLSKPPIIEESEPESTIDEVEFIETITGSTVEDLPSSAAENDTDNQSFKKIVKISLTTLKCDVKNIHGRIDDLENLLKKIHDKLSGQSNNSSIAIEDNILVVNNDDDLQILEDKLTNSSYRSSVVETLSHFSSDSLAETIRKIMRKMFSDTFLKQFSYIGFKGKRPFSTLQCCSVIFEAVRSIKKFKDVPNVDIEKPLKYCMAQAAQREKIKKQKSANV